MIDELILQILAIVDILNSKENVRTSELNFIYGLIDAFEDISQQIKASRTDSSVEDCLIEIRDALQHRLDCIIAREESMEETK